MGLGSTIGTRHPGGFDPFTLERYPQVQTSGLWHPSLEQIPNSLQVFGNDDCPVTATLCSSTQLDSEAQGPRQSQPGHSPRDDGNQS